MNNWKIIMILLFFLPGILMIGSCNDKEFLELRSTVNISRDAFFSDPDLIASNVAELYRRIVQYERLTSVPNNDLNYEMTEFNTFFPSVSFVYWRVRNNTYPYDKWAYWDYNYLHDINLFLDEMQEAKVDQGTKDRFIGEGLFLRATLYFNMVKSMGGVPILLDTVMYDFSGSADYLYRERASESEVYDLIIKEADAAAQKLPKDQSIKDRATWAAAMTLKSTAALFAGSIALHSQDRPNLRLPNGVVGIPSSKAEHYYQIALESAQEIIASNKYNLYLREPNNLQKNFADLFLDKNDNPEIIFVKNYTKDLHHDFTFKNMPFSFSESGTDGGVYNPSLNLVQSFEKLDNTFAPFKVKNPDGTYVVYDEVGDIFAGRDARLGGTVILPFSKYRDQDVDIFAGYYLPQQPAGHQFITGSQMGEINFLPGSTEKVQIVGKNGPIDAMDRTAQTGFYLRKFIDPAIGSGRGEVGSSVWWVYYRYSEVLLNAAEAAFHLGNSGLAAEYLNRVRSRAGFEVPLTAGQISFERIAHDRLSEFVGEDKYLWDIKRWRVADKIMNGGETDLNHPENPFSASTEPWGLWPFKIFNPGFPDNGKWIFRIVKPSLVTGKDNFRLGNYYSQISSDILSRNPKLIPNPNQ